MIANPRIYSDANPIIELAKWAKRTHDPSREPDLLMMDWATMGKIMAPKPAPTITKANAIPKRRWNQVEIDRE